MGHCLAGASLPGARSRNGDFPSPVRMVLQPSLPTFDPACLAGLRHCLQRASAGQVQGSPAARPHGRQGKPVGASQPARVGADQPTAMDKVQNPRESHPMTAPAPFIASALQPNRRHTLWLYLL